MNAEPAPQKLKLVKKRFIQGSIILKIAGDLKLREEEKITFYIIQQKVLQM